jgi:SAM-dependent methyltransferase
MSNRVDYDAELRMHNEALHRALKIGRHDRVLDIGCGAGQTTREAARVATLGSVVGVDISAGMIARAQALAAEVELRNVSFEHGDAQSHPFPSEHFDVAISRFGTMFFGDPIAAFSNIARALRPGARLVMMVWQSHEANEWSVAIQRALDECNGAPVFPPGSDPFSLAGPNTTERILCGAGFAHPTFTDVHEPVYYGQDVVSALEWVKGFAYTQDRLQRLDTLTAERALERLRETLAVQDHGSGVWFDSRAWIVTAIR